MLSCSMTALSRQITRANDHCNSDGNIVKCVKYGRYGKICVFDRNRHFRCVWIMSFSMTFNDHESDARVPFSGRFCNEFGRYTSNDIGAARSQNVWHAWAGSTLPMEAWRTPVIKRPSPRELIYRIATGPSGTLVPLGPVAIRYVNSRGESILACNITQIVLFH